MSSLRHGHAYNGKVSRTYTTWKMMKKRCVAPADPAYKYYGGRGIVICDHWMIFDNFLTDMGERPEGLELDRIDNNGNYEKSNCRWASRKTNMRNRRGCKLSERKVTLIRGLFLAKKAACGIGLFSVIVAPLFKICPRTVADVCSWRTWKA